MESLSIGVLFSSLVGLFALIGVGYWTVKAEIMPESACGPLTGLLLKVTLPCTIFSSLLRPFEARVLQDSLAVCALAIFFTFFLMALSWGLCRLLQVPQGCRGVWMMCCIFSNFGFMGYPVAQAIFGDDGLILAVMLGIPSNILFYAIGPHLAGMDRRGEEAGEKIPLRQTLVTAINAAALLGILFYCLQIPVPEAVQTPIRHLANITTPLSMLVTGMKLAGGKISAVIRDRQVRTATAIRLVVFPLLVWAVLRIIPGCSPLVTGVTLIVLAMPAPAASTILGERYHGNPELGARIVFLSSLLCIVTLPLVAMLL